MGNQLSDDYIGSVEQLQQIIMQTCEEMASYNQLMAVDCLALIHYQWHRITQDLLTIELSTVDKQALLDTIAHTIKTMLDNPLMYPFYHSRIPDHNTLAASLDLWRQRMENRRLE